MEPTTVGLTLGTVLPSLVFVRALTQLRTLSHQRTAQARWAQYFQLAAHCVAAALAATWLAATLSSFGTPGAAQRAQNNTQEGLALFVALVVLNEAPVLARALKGLLRRLAHAMTFLVRALPRRGKKQRHKS